MKSYNRVAGYLRRPWAIDPDSPEWAAILEVVDGRLRGQPFTADEIRARLDAKLASAPPAGPAGTVPAQVAVIPIAGVIAPHMDLMTAMSGGTTIDGLRSQFRQALADPGISGIVFDVRSPGGSVEGVPELAGEIRAARGRKPMAAVANYQMASAAYYLASQADEVVVSPSALVGSIGVLAQHEDWSASNEQMGVRTTYIYAGKNKVEANPNEPLADDARIHIQSLVDEAYGWFVGDVAKARGVASSVVRGESWGQGRVLPAATAVRVGMADRQGTLEDAISRVARGKVAMRVLADPVSITATSSDASTTTVAGVDEPPAVDLEREASDAAVRRARERLERERAAVS